MKSILAISVLCLTVSTTAHAGPSKKELCALDGSYARVVMMLRQMGEPLSKQIDTAPSFQKNAESIILAAYEYPRYSSGEYRERAIEDFGNEIELACYKQ